MTDFDKDSTVKINIVKPKNKGGRPNKNNTYKAEQKAVLDKLLNILGITETNKVFYIQDIEPDKNKIDQIIALESDVKKYYVCGKWTYFNKTVPLPWLSLAKSIIKHTGMNFKANSIRDGFGKTLKNGLLISN
jgi:hypothetical protein